MCHGRSELRTTQDPTQVQVLIRSRSTVVMSDPCDNHGFALERGVNLGQVSDLYERHWWGDALVVWIPGLPQPRPC